MIGSNARAELVDLSRVASRCCAFGGALCFFLFSDWTLVEIVWHARCADSSQTTREECLRRRGAAVLACTTIGDLLQHGDGKVCELSRFGSNLA